MSGVRSYSGPSSIPPRRGRCAARGFLNQYAETGLERDEVAVAAGLIVPLVERMPDDPRGGNYLRFLSQAYVTERPDSANWSAVEVDRDIRRYYRLYRLGRTDIASPLLSERCSVCF